MYAQDTNTALMVASEWGRDEVVRILVDSGADVNAINRVRARCELTPSCACKSMLSHSLTLTCGTCAPLLSPPLPWNPRQFDKTPLHFAAERGYDSVTQTLIELGADVEAANKIGYTPVMTAADAGHAAVVKTLLPHVQVDAADRVRVGWVVDAVSCRVCLCLCAPCWMCCDPFVFCLCVRVPDVVAPGVRSLAKLRLLSPLATAGTTCVDTLSMPVPIWKRETGYVVGVRRLSGTLPSVVGSPLPYMLSLIV